MGSNPVENLLALISRKPIYYFEREAEAGESKYRKYYDIKTLIQSEITGEFRFHAKDSSRRNALKIDGAPYLEHVLP